MVRPLIRKASNHIQGGRYAVGAAPGARVQQPYDVDATVIGNGDNSLFGVGASKNGFLFTAGKGLKATSATAVGASANEPLTNVFKLSNQAGDNVFNVSVNGISGIIEVPATSYVGTTPKRCRRALTRLSIRQLVLLLVV